MEAAAKPETVSLFALWKPHRRELLPFGECCRLVRAGEVPGAFAIQTGSLVVMADRAGEALGAMGRR